MMQIMTQINHKMAVKIPTMTAFDRFFVSIAYAMAEVMPGSINHRVGIFRRSPLRSWLSREKDAM
ncbi:hypothetical protein [Methanolobus chelungpuianus]|uniref:hypothetical protein n=1 Tax=Methanolobus chelungpuianus TaxID=502115 RepID=UPI002114F6C1|nr:hypothetical protein [Methanolobus chelungpuianus]